VDRDQSPVDDPQFPAVGGRRTEELGEGFGETVGDWVDSRVGDAGQGAELLHGEVGPVGEDEE
jgi:hypothetical protein